MSSGRSAWRLAAAAAALLLPAAGAAAVSLDGLLDSGWRVQKRWEEVARAGSFDYRLNSETFDGSGTVKRSVERRAEVRNGRVPSTFIVSEIRDGHDDTARARAAELRREKRQTGKRGAPIPSPFDPAFRSRYSYSTTALPGGGYRVAFDPRIPFDRALAGTAVFDADGRFRQAHFTLARLPHFTRRLWIDLRFDRDGNPVEARTSADVSFLFFRRRVESRVLVSHVEPAAHSGGGEAAP